MTSNGRGVLSYPLKPHDVDPVVWWIMSFLLDDSLVSQDPDWISLWSTSLLRTFYNKKFIAPHPILFMMPSGADQGDLAYCSHVQDPLSFLSSAPCI